MRKLFKTIGRVVCFLLVIAGFYFLTLLYPQPFFKNKFQVDNVTVFSDEKISQTELTKIVISAQTRIQQSPLHNPNIKYRVFFTNNPLRWRYFSNVFHKAGGIAYVYFNNIFFRKVDIINNRLYGNSGKVASGYRTLDYFMAHEMTHVLEFHSMPWYKYPLNTNWVLEGYADHVAHGSLNYQTSLDQYLYLPENKGAKYYTRARTMVVYLIEKEGISLQNLWLQTNDYGNILKRAIPIDEPNIVN